MTARPGFPAVSGAATFQDIRRSLSGQLVKSAAGVLRTGILPITTDRLITGTASMVVNVQTCVIVHDRNGAVYLPNDGVQPVQLSSAPSSGSRWSIVYSKQRETEAPFSDTAAGPLIDKVESTTSETAARNLLPAGARELGVWKVDAGTTTTNAATGVTYTETVPYTAMEGGVVLLRNQAEMDAWAPHDGALAYRLDLGQFAVREGGVWAYEEAGTFTFAETFYANHPDYEALKLSRRGKRSKLKGALSTNAAVPFNANTVYTVSTTIPTGWRPRTGADAICPIIFSGTSTVWGWARVTSAGLFQIWLSAAANSSAGAGGSVIPIDLEWANAA